MSIPSNANHRDIPESMRPYLNQIEAQLRIQAATIQKLEKQLIDQRLEAQARDRVAQVRNA